MAGAQQAEKIEAALRGGGGEGGEMGVADLGAKAVIGLVARAGVVHRDPGRARQPGAQYIARSRRAGPQPFSPVPPPFPKASEPSPSAWQASDRQYPQAAACPQRIRLAPP